MRVDGVAALVGGGHPGPGVAVLLRSDVELRARIHLWASGERRGDPSPDLLQATLSELIGESLIAGEAERLRVGEPRPAAVEQERARIAQQVGGEQALTELLSSVGVMPSEILGMAERRAVVSLFLDANLEGDNVVTEAGVDAALIALGVVEPEKAPQERRAEVREQLAKKSIERGVERWVHVLRSRNVVRIFARFGGR